MRITTICSDKVNCLSIRLDEVPGLDTSLIAKVHTLLLDKSIGIRNDRRYFLASTTFTKGSKVTKVNCECLSTNQPSMHWHVKLLELTCCPRTVYIDFSNYP